MTTSAPGTVTSTATVTTPGERTTQGPTAPPSTQDAPSTTPASPVGPPRCTRDQLALSLGRISPGAGNLYAPLIFTNTSSEACHLQGFPGVTLLDASGDRIGDPAERAGDMRPVVVLAPGKSAYAALHTVNKGVSDKPCRRPATWVQAYPPGSTWALRASADGFQECGGILEVSAVRPGRHP
ncbi:hypothetical protein STVIR_8125 [Streptomyces viridochromogenes Tue57]|uniref:DUF4232 domain-containing protein n=1 Tax=Streptomyces viridochromogenes Tue57 TaxID=1160705 RepID=L8P6E4_STRVR|nr:hypothetical protein STVIR_8125 [Streptomyces viridochromogenes Tue57]